MCAWLRDTADGAHRDFAAPGCYGCIYACGGHGANFT